MITEEEFEAMEEERKAEATQVVQDWVLETAIFVNVHISLARIYMAVVYLQVCK